MISGTPSCDFTNSLYDYTHAPIHVQIVLLLLLIFSGPLYAAKPVELTGSTLGAKAIALGKHLSFYEDTTGSLDIDDILNEPLPWVDSQVEVPNFGYTNSVFWLQSEVKNVSGKTRTFLFAIKYPLLDLIDAYFVENGKVIQSYQMGDTLPFGSRPIQHRDFLMPAKIEGNANIKLYLRVSTQGAMQVPLSIWDREQFLLHDQAELTNNAIYYGMILVMILYNLFIFISVRERSYLYYVGFVASFLLMQASMHGILYQYFYPNYPRIHELSILIAVPSTMLFSCLFTLSFLNLKKRTPWLHKIITVIVFLSIACIGASLVLPYNLSTRISVFLVIPASLLIMLSGPLSWYKGQKSAKYFTIAWLMLLVGTTSAAMSKFGFIPSNYFTEFGLQFGSALEAVLLSFALADRFNRRKEALLQAQQEKIAEAQQRKNAEERLLYQSTHRSNTGLPNQVLLQNRIENLTATNRSDDRFAVIMIHLDRFHEIAKTLGQTNAELLLKTFSERLSGCASNSIHAIPVEENGSLNYYAAQLDSVTFILLHTITENSYFTNALLSLKRQLQDPIDFREMRIEIGMSLGVSIFPDHGSDANTLLTHAQVATDLALKNSQKTAIYDANINPYSEKRLSLMGDLQNAIEENTLSLHYQPLFDLKNNKVVGAEALVRWNHPIHGFIPPEEFIPHTEKTGMIKQLTYWVLNSALFALSQLTQTWEDFELSVNISANNLQESGFIKNIQALLAKHDVQAYHLVLEVTESAMMENPHRALTVLKQLSQLGVQIAIDDFGTGYSSLSYLKKLPANKIKIDRSFVMEMNKVNDDAIIVGTTLDMCHSLGFEVVAEGIEDIEVLDQLKDFNCDYAQGYYIAHPLTYDELTSWLADPQSHI